MTIQFLIINTEFRNINMRGKAGYMLLQRIESNQSVNPAEIKLSIRSTQSRFIIKLVSQ